MKNNIGKNKPPMKIAMVESSSISKNKKRKEKRASQKLIAEKSVTGDYIPFMKKATAKNFNNKPSQIPVKKQVPQVENGKGKSTQSTEIKIRKKLKETKKNKASAKVEEIVDKKMYLDNEAVEGEESEPEKPTKPYTKKCKSLKRPLPEVLRKNDDSDESEDEFEGANIIDFEASEGEETETDDDTDVDDEDDGEDVEVESEDDSDEDEDEDIEAETDGDSDEEEDDNEVEGEGDSDEQDSSSEDEEELPKSIKKEKSPEKVIPPVKVESKPINNKNKSKNNSQEIKKEDPKKELFREEKEVQKQVKKEPGIKEEILVQKQVKKEPGIKEEILPKKELLIKKKEHQKQIKKEFNDADKDAVGFARNFSTKITEEQIRQAIESVVDVKIKKIVLKEVRRTTTWNNAILYMNSQEDLEKLLNQKYTVSDYSFVIYKSKHAPILKPTAFIPHLPLAINLDVVKKAVENEFGENSVTYIREMRAFPKSNRKNALIYFGDIENAKKAIIHGRFSAGKSTFIIREAKECGIEVPIHRVVLKNIPSNTPEPKLKKSLQAALGKNSVLKLHYALKDPSFGFAVLGNGGLVEKALNDVKEISINDAKIQILEYFPHKPKKRASNSAKKQRNKKRRSLQNKIVTKKEAKTEKSTDPPSAKRIKKNDGSTASSVTTFDVEKKTKKGTDNSVKKRGEAKSTTESPNPKKLKKSGKSKLTSK